VLNIYDSPQNNIEKGVPVSKFSRVLAAGLLVLGLSVNVINSIRNYPNRSSSSPITESSKLDLGETYYSVHIKSTSTGFTDLNGIEQGDVFSFKDGTTDRFIRVGAGVNADTEGMTNVYFFFSNIYHKDFNPPILTYEILGNGRSEKKIVRVDNPDSRGYFEGAIIYPNRPYNISKVDQTSIILGNGRAFTRNTTQEEVDFLPEQIIVTLSDLEGKSIQWKITIGRGNYPVRYDL